MIRRALAYAKLTCKLAVLFGLAALPVAGCSAALPLPPVTRALCYANADQAAQAAVDRECRIGDAGVQFAECPAHDAIMAKLASDQKDCP